MNPAIPALTFHGATGAVRLQFDRYRTGTLSVQISDDEGAYARPSVSLEDHAHVLGELQFFVKKWDMAGDAVLKELTVTDGQSPLFELVADVEVEFGNFGQVASVWQVTTPYRAVVAELAGIELEPEEALPAPTL